MRRKNQRSVRQDTGASYTQWLAMWLLGMIMIVVLIVTVNIGSLQKETTRIADNYVTDVTRLIAGEVHQRMQMTIEQLETIGDSVGRMRQERLYDFLERKRKLLNFRLLGVGSLEGIVTFPDGSQQDFSGEVSYRKALQGEEAPYGYGEDEIIYTVPINLEGKQIGVIVGIRSKEYMQGLVQSAAFEGQGNSCIVDKEGDVIIPPPDGQVYNELSHFLQKPENLDEAQKLAEDVRNDREGQVAVDDIGDTDYVLSHIGIETNDWLLLSMIPSDMIFKKLNGLFLQTFVAIIAVLGLFGIMIPIIVRVWKKNQKNLEHLAFTDPVTGEMNNLKFRLECRKLLEEEEPQTRSMVAMNIKNFKVINENYGSQTGDRILSFVVKTLKSYTGVGELAARGEADHFYLFLRAWDEEEIEERLEEILDSMRSFAGEEGVCGLTLAAGIYRIEDHDLEVTIMQDRANLACKYHEEGMTENIFFYDFRIMRQLQKEKALHDMADKAFADREFQVYLQPKVELHSEQVKGAEALIRWVQPGPVVISPGDFIPAFERSGIICRLDLYVFEQICRFLRRRIDEDREIFPVSVNLSRVHLRREGFLEDFVEIRKKYDVPPSLIELELTESMFMDQEAMEIAIRQIHEAGFLCSMDDFGSGYSSLGLLTAFDIDVIKLDRSFFINRSRKQSEVIESVVTLAGRLGIRTVAEGIEEKEQLDFLRRIGCSMVQGYVYSRPLSMPDFEAWISGGGVQLPPPQ